MEIDHFMSKRLRVEICILASDLCNFTLILDFYDLKDFSQNNNGKRTKIKRLSNNILLKYLTELFENYSNQCKKEE